MMTSKGGSFKGKGRTKGKLTGPLIGGPGTGCEREEGVEIHSRGVKVVRVQGQM